MPDPVLGGSKPVAILSGSQTPVPRILQGTVKQHAVPSSVGNTQCNVQLDKSGTTLKSCKIRGLFETVEPGMHK